MLWFGLLKQFNKVGLLTFKNILCYGSAGTKFIENTLNERFKNILCYGSALFFDQCHPRLI